jgi:hypothetical protein
MSLRIARVGAHRYNGMTGKVVNLIKWKDKPLVKTFYTNERGR